MRAARVLGVDLWGGGCLFVLLFVFILSLAFGCRRILFFSFSLFVVVGLFSFWRDRDGARTRPHKGCPWLILARALARNDSPAFCNFHSFLENHANVCFFSFCWSGAARRELHPDFVDPLSLPGLDGEQLRAAVERAPWMAFRRLRLEDLLLCDGERAALAAAVSLAGGKDSGGGGGGSGRGQTT